MLPSFAIRIFPFSVFLYGHAMTIRECGAGGGEVFQAVYEVAHSMPSEVQVEGQGMVHALIS
jgi:hypothetical protein